MKSVLRGAFLFIIFWLAAPVIAQAPATVPAPPPIEAFAQLPFLSSPLLSPDGTRVAARVASGGRQLVGIWTLSAPRDAPPELIEVPNLENFTWAGSGRLLISSLWLNFGFSNSAFMIGPARRFLIHELNSGDQRPLEREPGMLQDVIFVDPAGRYVLLSRLDRGEDTPAVHRIDLRTGESVLVQPPVRGVWAWFADNEGVVRVGIDYGERRTRIYYRAAPTGQLSRLETRQELLDDSIVEMVRLTSASGRGILGTNAVTGRFAVYEYDFATATRGAALFEHPQVDVSSAMFAPDGSVDGFTYDDERPRVQWLNPAMARVQVRLDAALPGRTNLILNRSADGNRMLVFSSAADDPGTYLVFDQAARRLEIFASPYDRLQGHAFAAVRPISYRNRDGLTLQGYLTLPRGRPERGLPLVVLPHGGPFLRDRWAFDPEVQFLASRGYAVLQTNFRGSTGFGRQFVERGYGQLGTGMIDDIDDGTDWAIAEGIADPARICIMGSSYGGYAAIWAAMRSPQRYRCAISWAGPSDLPAMMRRDTRFLVAERYVRERRRQLVGDEEVSLRAISPIRYPERMRVPVLIAHGENDLTVPVDQSKQLIRALTRRGANLESVIYPKSGHNFTEASESVDYLRRVEAFLARHNPAAAPATAPTSIPSQLEAAR